MVFHAKALEGFAQCYQALGEIREEEDLEVKQLVIQGPEISTPHHTL